MTDKRDKNSRTSSIGVLVVGAGVAGLQVARTCLQSGFRVVVLEEGNDVGGVWASNYVSFGLQVPWKHYQFPDFPYPPDLIPRNLYPKGAEVHQYVQAYARHFGLYDHIRFRCSLVHLAQDARSGRWQAVFCDLEEAQHYRLTADFVVVCTGILRTPFIPKYPGQDRFRGQQLHARDFTDVEVARGRNVVVVGSGKTGLDCATELALSNVASSVTLLYRKLHWPLPRKLGPLSSRFLLFTRASSSLLPEPYYTAGPLARASSALLRPAKRLVWRGLEALVAHKFKLDKSRRPQEPLWRDIYYGGQVFDEAYNTLMRSPRVKTQQGRIRHMSETGLVLEDGRELACDVLLYCTGYQPSLSFLDPGVLEALAVEDDGLYLYRNILHPAVRNLAFVGANVSTFNNILTHGLQSQWLVKALRGELLLPSRAEMLKDIEAQKRWRRDFMPVQHNRGAMYMPYTQAYHDQLIRDCGGKPNRKGWNPLKECFSPYSACDYYPNMRTGGNGGGRSSSGGPASAVGVARPSCTWGLGTMSPTLPSMAPSEPTCSGALCKSDCQGLMVLELPSNASCRSATSHREGHKTAPPSLNPLSSHVILPTASSVNAPSTHGRPGSSTLPGAGAGRAAGAVAVPVAGAGASALLSPHVHQALMLARTAEPQHSSPATTLPPHSTTLSKAPSTTTTHMLQHSQLPAAGVALQDVWELRPVTWAGSKPCTPRCSHLNLQIASATASSVGGGTVSGTGPVPLMSAGGSRSPLPNSCTPLASASPFTLHSHICRDSNSGALPSLLGMGTGDFQPRSNSRPSLLESAGLTVQPSMPSASSSHQSHDVICPSAIAVGMHQQHTPTSPAKRTDRSLTRSRTLGGSSSRTLNAVGSSSRGSGGARNSLAKILGAALKTATGAVSSNNSIAAAPCTGTNVSGPSSKEQGSGPLHPAASALERCGHGRTMTRSASSNRLASGMEAAEAAMVRQLLNMPEGACLSNRGAYTNLSASRYSVDGRGTVSQRHLADVPNSQQLHQQPQPGAGASGYAPLSSGVLPRSASSLALHVRHNQSLLPLAGTMASRPTSPASDNLRRSRSTHRLARKLHLGHSCAVMPSPAAAAPVWSRGSEDQPQVPGSSQQGQVPGSSQPRQEPGSSHAPANAVEAAEAAAIKQILSVPELTSLNVE